MFENVDDGRTTDAWLYFKIAYEPKGSSKLIKVKKINLRLTSPISHGKVLLRYRASKYQFYKLGDLPSQYLVLQ